MNDSYVAFRKTPDEGEFSFEGRDADAGILGSFTGSPSLVVATGNSLAELRIHARAYLGKEPGASLYLTDAHGRVYEMMRNEKHHVEVAKTFTLIAVLFALLFFCLSCLLAAFFGTPAKLAFYAFLGAGALYGLIVRIKFYNAIEGAVICEISLILALLLLPSFVR